jgi:exopolysaccharide biosynthesis polyprenyl glycosylphosphotransferase
MSPFYCKRFITARVILDLLLFPCVLILSYSFKFKIGWLFQNWFNIQDVVIYESAQIEPYLSGILYLLIIWGVSFYYGGVYRYHSDIMPEVDEIVSIIKGASLATFLVMALTFIISFMPGSRYVIFYMWLVGICVFSLGHYGIYHFQLYYYRLGKCVKKAIIVGGDEFSQDIIERIITVPSLAIKYCGTYSDKHPDKVHFTIQNQFKWLGKIEKLMTHLEGSKIDIVFVSQHLDQSLKALLIDHCSHANIELNIISKEVFYYSNRLSVKEIDGIPFVSYHPLFEWSWTHYIKRVFDIIVASLGLLTLLPLLMGIAVWIKCRSPQGTSIYKQDRVGKDGQVFSFYKFRTMIPNAEKKTGPVWVSEEQDDRCIKGGSFLRKYSLDELPQLVNVIKGDMSIVGPRPERPFFVTQLSEKIPYYDLRHKMKGGITGWAQINGRSALTRNPQHKAKYDLFYIKNWTIVWDIKIILKTILMVIKGENAY